MKKVPVGLLILCSLILISSLAIAAYTGIPGRIGLSATISATDTATELVISRRHFKLKNDGTDEFYFVLNTDVDATTSNSFLNSGEGIVFDSDEYGEIYNIQYICDTGETASVRYWAWD